MNLCMASDAPQLNAEDLASGGSLTNFDAIALLCFLGTIVFCAVQACLAPRKTFCAERVKDS